ncbi:pseudoazurin [Thalassospira sp. TSL5-1]|uniref:pseudoazurin n=1 Tax=Thalassospira sp. TSL5-1 TaxID=1544451 RepID=UPI00093F9657|nr:pseudoazurin [Thalassospira sp. TSL5-1]OKH86745.1 pseudoazurin [Thalassospira sp. TSL5-1]
MFRTIASALVLATLFGTTAMAETFEVKMLNKSGDQVMVFEPDHLRLAPGDSVKFVPTSKGHNAETVKDRIPEGAKPFAGKISKEIEVTFDTEGFYAVECKPHYAMGMVMTIVVGDSAKAPESFLEGRIPPKAKARFEEQLSKL